MLAKYATIVRRAGAVTLAAAVVMVAVCAALGGHKALIGSLLGVALVTVFFGISVGVVGWAARISPSAMMLAAIVSYLVKIIALAIVLSALNGTTVFSTRAFAVTALVCILVWCAAQVVTAMKVKMLYVEPDAQAEPRQPARRGQ
jgi:ATP synthase protein I